jgi:tetratricopeptide (TPR) repeat protein
MRPMSLVLLLSLVTSCAIAGEPLPVDWRAEAARGVEALEAGEAAIAVDRLEAAAEDAEEADAPALDRARLLVLLGKAHWAAGRSRPAYDVHHRALKLLEGVAASEAALLLRAEALTEIGNLSFPLHQDERGLEALAEALSIRRELLAPTSPELIESLILQGVAYQMTGELEQAERLLREAVTRLGESATATADDKAAALRSLAKVLELQGRAAEAADVSEEADRSSEASPPS